MSITDAITSETALTLLGALLGSLWTIFKSSEWFARRRKRRFQQSVQALAAAVEATYRDYVQSIKASRADGRLTEAEKARARALARERAVAIAQNQGLDVLRELGAEHVDLWIAKLVKKLKRK